jgi:putative nucleotidyltransferase with HDIG domain
LFGHERRVLTNLQETTALISLASRTPPDRGRSRLARGRSGTHCTSRQSNGRFDVPTSTQPRERDVGRVVEGGIGALTYLLDLRDSYTATHAGEVGPLCASVGRRLGLSAPALQDLDVAARLHDLGKIGVPDVILNKPGPLTSAEWDVMRRHPVWGAEALALVPGTEAVAAVVRAHHERWDGSGYPDGLAGEAIPPAARIIAVADAWHAMTSDRSYRRALDAEHARQELADGAGSQFDAQVVEAFLELLDATVAPASTRFRRDAAAARPSRAAALGVAMGRVMRLPALRESRARMEELLADPGTPAEQLLGVVEADPALAVAVIRQARVTSIPVALKTLPRDELAAIVRERSTIDYFQYVAGWRQPPEHLRLHGIATQRAAGLIARARQRDDVDALLVGALLHDVGKLVLEQAYPSYPAAVHGEASTPDDRVRAEQAALGLDHAVVGGVILRRWGVPEEIAAMVERHHAPTAEGPAAVLRLADMVAHYAHAHPVDPHLMEHAAAAAGLSAELLRTVMFDVSRHSQETPRATEPSPLSRSETLVLRGLAAGQTYKEIAAAHGLSVSTIRSHCHGAYRRLGVADRSQAVLAATARGWL